jgi:hypothetical protein
MFASLSFDLAPLMHFLQNSGRTLCLHKMCPALFLLNCEVKLVPSLCSVESVVVDRVRLTPPTESLPASFSTDFVCKDTLEQDPAVWEARVSWREEVPAGIFGDFAGDASGEGGSNC